MHAPPLHFDHENAVLASFKSSSMPEVSSPRPPTTINHVLPPGGGFLFIHFIERIHGRTYPLRHSLATTRPHTVFVFLCFHCQLPPLLAKNSLTCLASLNSVQVLIKYQASSCSTTSTFTVLPPVFSCDSMFAFSQRIDTRSDGRFVSHAQAHHLSDTLACSKAFCPSSILSIHLQSYRMFTHPSFSFRSSGCLQLPVLDRHSMQASWATEPSLPYLTYHLDQYLALPKDPFMRDFHLYRYSQKTLSCFVHILYPNTGTDTSVACSRPIVHASQYA